MPLQRRRVVGDDGAGAGGDQLVQASGVLAVHGTTSKAAAWARWTCSAGQGPFPQKFTGKERDGESGLDYFLSRYYASSLGRFNSVDPGNAGALLGDPLHHSRPGSPFGSGSPQTRHSVRRLAFNEPQEAHW